jgi:hypothetical protein
MRKIILFIGLVCFALPPVCAQNSSINLAYSLKAESKIANLTQQIGLDSTQQHILKNAYMIYCHASDSVVTNQQNKDELKKSQFEIKKKWQSTLLKILNNEQRVKYFTDQAIPLAKAKTTEKLKLLKALKMFTEQELSKKEKELYRYYLKESFINKRDAYNPKRKAWNQRWLDDTGRTQAVREVKAIEEMKNNGKLDNENNQNE